MQQYGLESSIHVFSGNQEKIQNLLELAGFSNIKIHEKERGRWMNPDELKDPFTVGGYTPGQYQTHLKAYRMKFYCC